MNPPDSPANRQKLLLTGSSGFFGTNFSTQFQNDNFEIIPFDRKRPLPEQIANIDTVIHAAGLAHSPNIKTKEAYFAANYTLTKNLIDNFTRTENKRFIFLSTIKVLGEYTPTGQALTENSPYNPSDYYSESKIAAEEYLQKVAHEKTTILRPVVMYGKGAKGNFATLNKYCHLPLPLKSITARRSLLYVGNLSTIIEKLLQLPVFGQIYNCSDPHPKTIGEIIEAMALAKNKRAHLIPFNENLLHWALCTLGKQNLIDRLMKDFIVRTEKLREDLALSESDNFIENIRDSF